MYGKAPSNTTLTVVYSHGGGVESNVPMNSITTKRSMNLSLSTNGLDSALVQQTRNSIAFDNMVAATGGRGEESLNEIKENTRQLFHKNL